MYEQSLKKELEKIKKSLASEDKPVGVQLPEGLKQHTTLVLDALKDHEPILFTDPSFGACDLRDEEAKKFGCKLLIHFGHACMGKQRIKTIFAPVSYLFNEEEFDFLIKEIIKLKEKTITLVTTINFLEELPRIKQELNKKRINTTDTKESSHVQRNHVLGCDSSTITNSKNPVVFVGDGDFHPNNLGFTLQKTKVFVINPIQRKTKKLEINDLFIKQRYATIARAKKCKSFGIFVSSKHGQFRLRLAKHVKKKLEEQGKKAYIIGCDYVSEDYVEGIKIDCYVNTACPRIAYDDFRSFKKPIITPQEVALLEDTTRELRIDQITKLEEFYDE